MGIEDLDVKDKERAIAICCSVLLGITILLLALSVSILGPTEAGLDHNSISQQVDTTRVWGPGRHLLGLGHNFVRFSTGWNSVDFSGDPKADRPSLDTFANDGNSVVYDVSFAYRIPARAVPVIYKRYKTNYSERLLDVATASLKNRATFYNTTEVFQKRATINQEMQVALEQVLADNSIPAQIVNLQLRGISLPVTVEQALINKILASQQAQTTEALQQVAVIEADTAVLVAQMDAQVNVLGAQGAANASTIIQIATATADEQLRNAQAVGLSTLASTVGLTDPQQVIQYTLIRQLKIDNHTNYIIGFGGANLLINR